MYEGMKDLKAIVIVVLGAENWPRASCTFWKSGFKQLFCKPDIAENFCSVVFYYVPTYIYIVQYPMIY